MDRGGRRGGGRYRSPRGRSSPSAGHSPNRHGSVGSHGYSRNASSGRGVLQYRRKNPETTPVGVSCPSNIISSAENLKLECNTTKLEYVSPKYQESASTPPSNIISSAENLKLECNTTKLEYVSPKYQESVSTPPNMNERKTHQEQLRGAGKESFSLPHLGGTSPVDASYTKKGPSQSSVSDSKESHFGQETQSRTSATENTVGDGRPNDSDSLQKGYSFDICVEKIGSFVKLQPPLLVKNREKKNEMKRRTEGENIKVLRPGVVLLKCYLPLMDQVKLVKMCRDLGLGSGGFYQPGYRDGAQLRLKMMCLGKNWDPETSVYSDERPTDGAKPPPIPAEFLQLVKGAIQDSHAYLESTTKVRKVEDIFPSMSPNICIVNFYTQRGSLGLHQVCRFT
ncbi:uncharacterized protein LOC111404405 [Olea europaea var. sylvestris]|uniref:Alkylated DNA repair n=1 Tax=Olea europaea subsp. europaea TaxID=158383 RepID=A0A8S0S2Q4_OLEEU|nr:uncharacterized protein LOC111404405 [Olea europaea var. sylvestris]CAA2985867.1 Alkylated DNA repair [Olea europaea subsp. europaea]